ncbi:hypothetical protein CRG98_025877 [Punica granatum]|uniref:Uncharacterized protein n=1 Tax=Punica granatum TaxID=22663 RepID=A0A2I0JBZ1_PUNGR|nr:hypothetical protein CRG98_025877 [Punica granatum]
MKTTRTTRNTSQVISTDTLYSDLIDLQDQVQAHFSDNWSPSHQFVPSEVHGLPCKPSAQPNPPVQFSSPRGPCRSPFSSPTEFHSAFSPQAYRTNKASRWKPMETQPTYSKDFTITISQRKRKNDMALEDSLIFSAPYSRIMNKMARTVGDCTQMDWTVMQHVSHWQQITSPIEQHMHSYMTQAGVVSYPEDMDQEDIPEHIQIAEEAGLNKPPTPP